MSNKELKVLKESHEHLRDQLRLKTENIKQTRAQIRSLANGIKQKEQEIAGSESKQLENKDDFKHSENETSLKNLEAYNAAFTRISSQQLFEPIKSITDPTLKLSQTVTSVDIQFQKVTISFFVSHLDTFERLRTQVSSYWAMPEDEIFFSDQSPDDGTQPLFLLHDKIIETLYVWEKTKLKNKNFLLYLVLRNYTSLTERMDQLFPKEDEVIFSELDVDDLKTRLKEPSKKKDKAGAAVNKLEVLKTRKKWMKIQYFAQWVLFVVVFFLWVFFITSDADVSKSTWINKTISHTLLWDFQFDDSNQLSMYASTQNSQYLRVTSIKKLWQYVNSLLNEFTSVDNLGILQNQLYLLEYMELRQLRSTVNTCNYNNIFNYTCVKDFNFITNNFEGPLNDGSQSYQKYTSRNSGIFVYGDLALYPLGGYLNSVEMLDAVEFTATIQGLINNKWVDEGTRAFFITMNIYNPSSDIMTMAMVFFEITASEVFLQNFKLYSLNRHPYTSGVQAAHVFILLFMFFLILMELRQNIRHPEETKVFIYNEKLDDAEKIFDQLQENGKKNLFNRLKLPTKDELFRIFTIWSLIVLEVINLSLFFGTFEDSIQLGVGYTNMFGALQGVAMLNDAKNIMTLLIAFNIMRFIIVWMVSVSRYFEVVIHMYSQLAYFVFLTLLPILIFTVLVMYFLGPYDRAFNTLEQAFVSTVRIFCGNWPSNLTFLYFTDSGFLVILYFVFIIWRSLALHFQAIHFQMGAYKIQLKHN